MGTDEDIADIVELLSEVSEDRTVPRNIRGAAANAMEILQDNGKDSVVKASEAIAVLDEISTDLNMPVHARTKIWNILSLLETITSESQE